MKKEFTIQLPESKDPLGKWMERNNVHLDVSCMLGRFHVTLSWKKLHSYSDDKGEHSETWSLTRMGEELPTTLQEAIKATGLK